MRGSETRQIASGLEVLDGIKLNEFYILWPPFDKHKYLPNPYMYYKIQWVNKGKRQELILIIVSLFL